MPQSLKEYAAERGKRPTVAHWFDRQEAHILDEILAAPRGMKGISLQKIFNWLVQEYEFPFQLDSLYSFIAQKRVDART